MTRRRMIWIGLALIFAFLYLYRPYFPKAAYNEKMTLTIATPGGLVSGAAVTRVTLWQEPSLIFPEAGGGFHKVRGEAVVVDLGEGRVLFALLPHEGVRAAYAADRRIEAFDPDAFRRYVFKLKYLTSHAPADVQRENYPRLVTFADISEPSSVALVDPDDLAASFGPGCALEAVTEGVVEGVLPCLNSGKACIPLNTHYEYGHPLRNILNSAFLRKAK